MKTENRIGTRRLRATLALPFAAVVAMCFAIEPATGMNTSVETGRASGMEIDVQDEPQESRVLKLVVRDRRGRPVSGTNAMAGINGTDMLQPLDADGKRLLTVTDRDTVVLVTGKEMMRLPVAGFDSLYVTFRNRNRIGSFFSRNVDGGESDLVNIGFGSVRDRYITSSVGRLDMSNAEGFADLKTYIVGRVAGVQVVGEELIIRGTKSLMGSSAALIVVDGTVMPDFESVNGTIPPVDVANISVLKDGSSSIYGSRGANGVVLITTKGGNAR